MLYLLALLIVSILPVLLGFTKELNINISLNIVLTIFLLIILKYLI